MYTLKTFKQLVADSIATVKSRCNLTDFNRVSGIRALVEATSLQLADLYVQVAKLREIFSIYTATGADLDARAQDYGLSISRLPATAASGSVVFGDSTVVKKVATVTAAGVNPASTTIQVSLGGFNVGSSFADLPASGVVILDRATPALRESLSYSSKSNPDIINLSSVPANTHTSGATLVLSRLGTDKTVSSGTAVIVPATNTDPSIVFKTSASGTLLDGDIWSDPVPTSATTSGAAYNVADTLINTFQSLPWATALVNNPTPFSGGADVESDKDLRSRITGTVQSLSRGTVLALEFLAVQVTYLTKRILFSKVVENLSVPEVTLYVNDGSVSTPTPAQVTTIEVAVGHATANKKAFKLVNWPIVGNPRLFKSSLTGTISSKLNTSPGVMRMYNASYAPGSPNTLAGEIFVDVNNLPFVILADDTGYIDVAYSSLVPAVGVYTVVVVSSGELSVGTDYIFNSTTGDVELTAALSTNQSVIAYPVGGVAYSYYDGLMREVQRVINGDPSDFAKYPGVRSAGVKVIVAWPSIRTVPVTLAIQSDFGVTESTLYTPVKAAIVGYINSLTIGQDVVIAEIIAAAMSVVGVADAQVSSPSGNQSILDDELARTSASIVTVS